MVLRGAAILVVEDSYLLGEAICQAFLDAGATAVHLEATSAGAIDFLGHNPVALASLDFDLIEGTSEPVADALVQAGIPFVFFSGQRPVADSCRFAEWVSKPNIDRLLEVVLDLPAMP